MPAISRIGISDCYKNLHETAKAESRYGRAVDYKEEIKREKCLRGAA